LAEKNISQPEAEARVLLLAATHMSRTQLITQSDRIISTSEADILSAWIARRLHGEPVTRIAGRRDFWTLDLRVTPDVLDPRADTEVIVETALDLLGIRRTQALRILDLGTGTGALLLALLSECPHATGVGIDLSPAACAVAQDNAQRNGLAARAKFQQGHWADALHETFDLVVSNPPYIESATIAGLDAEVREHDPMLALDGGPDGLTAYRGIVKELPRLLSPAGLCVLELGIGQAGAVTALAEGVGLTQKALRPDLGGVERALALGRP
jgi:release factor glutamine methyltransferase